MLLRIWEDDVIESLLLAVTRVTTMLDREEKTNATGFFFERDNRLYLVTARHVLRDEASGHHPDSLAIELHVDAENAVQVTRFLIPLFVNGEPLCGTRESIPRATSMWPPLNWTAPRCRNRYRSKRLRLAIWSGSSTKSKSARRS
jgi:hypothetical protein